MKMTRKELLEMKILLETRISVIEDFDDDQKQEVGYLKEIGLISNVLEKIQTALDGGRE